MRRSLSVVAVLVALLGLTACSNHAAAPDPAGDASAADAMFAQMMIPHHEQAVVMADLAPTRAQVPQILELATEIKGAQQPEIDQMAAWLEEWGVPRLAGDEAMAAHGSHGMSGMLTDEQLAELEASSGTDFDQLFAQLMIEHHEGAIEMANAVVDSSDPRVAQLAKQIISTQEGEIEQLRPLAGS
jgi:uncharacterized protein (DUF305 family)